MFKKTIEYIKKKLSIDELEKRITKLENNICILQTEIAELKMKTTKSEIKSIYPYPKPNEWMVTYNKSKTKGI